MIDFGGLRILHGVDDTDTQQGGGTATRTVDVAEQLAKRGANCTIASINKDATELSYSVVNKVERIEIPSLLKRFYIPNIAVRELDALVAGQDVLSLMGHWSPINIYLARSARRQNIPYVVCGAGSFKIWGRSKRLKQAFNLTVGNKFVQKASGWIAVVGEETVDFRQYGVNSSFIDVIPNGIESVDERQPLANTFSGLDFVVFLGRLNLIKGPDLLVRAFAEVSQFLPFNLILAGPDKGLEAELRNIVEEQNLGERISFIGFVDGDAKASLLSNARALILPSRKEAMSVVALEAGSYGTPVVATTECGLDDLLASDAGMLVEPTVEGVARGLMALADGRDWESSGNELKRLVLERFGWDMVALQYLELYRRVTASK